MNYFWTVCPKCACEVAVQFAAGPGGVSGSLRRWSSDRSTNDGRRVDVPAAEVAPDGGFRALCVCGQTIDVDPARVTRATTEMPAV